MPELPEVETVKRYLERSIIGRKFIDVKILWSRVINKKQSQLKEYLVGETIQEFKRFGKYLVFILSNNKAIISHFRMEGRFYVRKNSDADSPHAEVVFKLDNDIKLIYDDSRRFGLIEIWDADKISHYPGIHKIGPEPWSLSSDELEQILTAKNAGFKKSLLNQELVAGIGNIYADEIAFASGIHPKTLTRTIPACLFQDILNNAKSILDEAIRQNGTQVLSFTGAQDMPPHYQYELICYGRANLPCRKCGRPLRKTFIGGRGTTYCPHCQKNYNRPIIVGVTGQVLSGKTTICNIFKNLGYPVIDCDSIVNSAYLNETIQEKMAKITSFPVSSITKVKIRALMGNSPELFSQIEKLLFDFVKREISRIKKGLTHSKIIVVEAPLLFKAELEESLDFIVGVNASFMTQCRRLETRPCMTDKDLLIYNKSNTYLKNITSVDFGVATDEADSNELTREVKKIIRTILD